MLLYRDMISVVDVDVSNRNKLALLCGEVQLCLPYVCFKRNKNINETSRWWWVDANQI